MTSANYVVNIVNLVRNRQLKNLVQKGRAQLKLMSENVKELEDQVDNLNGELKVQEKVSERLRLNLEATRTLLETSITEVWNFLMRIMMGFVVQA